MATASAAPSAPVSLGAPSFLRSRPRAERTGRRHPACTERIVTVRDGVQLAVRDQGPSRAEATVVLLHGLCLEKGSWAGQIRHLTRQWGDRIRIISYDHRGHGRSGSAPNRTYTVEQLAEDLADVLTALRVTGPLTLAGHSMGGMVALAYLGRPPADRPVEPHGLVLAATAAGRLAERGVARLLASPRRTCCARSPPSRLSAPFGCLPSLSAPRWPSRSAATRAPHLRRCSLMSWSPRDPSTPPSGSCPACGPTTKPPRSPRSALRRPSSAAESTSSPHLPTRTTWPVPSPAPLTSTFPLPGTCSSKRPPTPSRMPSAARSPPASAPVRDLQLWFTLPDNGIRRTRGQHDRPKRIVAPLD